MRAFFGVCLLRDDVARMGDDVARVGGDVAWSSYHTVRRIGEKILLGPCLQSQGGKDEGESLP